MLPLGELRFKHLVIKRTLSASPPVSYFTAYATRCPVDRIDGWRGLTHIWGLSDPDPLCQSPWFLAVQLICLSKITLPIKGLLLCSPESLCLNKCYQVLKQLLVYATLGSRTQFSVEFISLGLFSVHVSLMTFSLHESSQCRSRSDDHSQSPLSLIVLLLNFSVIVFGHFQCILLFIWICL